MARASAWYWFGIELSRKSLSEKPFTLTNVKRNNSLWIKFKGKLYYPWTWTAVNLLLHTFNFSLDVSQEGRERSEPSESEKCKCQISECAFAAEGLWLQRRKEGFPEPARDISRPRLTWLLCALPTEVCYPRECICTMRELAFYNDWVAAPFELSRRLTGLEQQTITWLMRVWMYGPARTFSSWRTWRSAACGPLIAGELSPPPFPTPHHLIILYVGHREKSVMLTCTASVSVDDLIPPKLRDQHLAGFSRV